MVEKLHLNSKNIRYTVNMSKSDKSGRFHRWYFKDWMTDPFVKGADFETIGVYITLLHCQMEEGSIPSSPKRIHSQIGRSISYERFLEIWEGDPSKEEIVPLRKMFKEFKRVWVSTQKSTNPKESGYWQDLDEPVIDKLDGKVKLINETMHQVIQYDDRIFNGSKIHGEAGGRIASDNRILSGSLESHLEQDATGIDFSALLKVMPKRRDKSGRLQGWNAGVNMLKYTDSQEMYDAILAAAKNYAKEKPDPLYTISFGKFMKEWKDYLPLNYGAKSDTAQSQSLTKPTEITEYKNTEERVSVLRAKGCRIEDPPWVPQVTDDQELLVKRASFTEEQKSKWLNNYLDNPNQS